MTLLDEIMKAQQPVRRGEAVKEEHLTTVTSRFLNGTLAPSFMPLHAVSI